ncbi:hypothetical protein R1sor_020452 [Riccia sorocarpa]|uniref:Uncharacterized protein n=1 Tax=Riccia sorocarpa TaxID=122646 RepID=A0ABD3IJ40_9MARC
MIREPKAGGAITNIIHSVTWDFGDIPTPKIPLCRLVPFCRVRQFQTSSIQTEALKKSFETQCYMEHASTLHVSPFDENGEPMFVKQEDKDKWDTLWRMKSDAFDAEMLKEPAYKELANRMFSTWDGNHRVIAWTEYDWIQDAERCRQVLSTPLNTYNAMIGDDVYEEFEKSRIKVPPNKAWYNENMTATAASYILSYAEVTAAKDLQPDVEAEEEKRLGKTLTSKQKKEMWDAKVKEVCASWQHIVFKYATIVNPQLGPEFLETVRELHDQLAKIEKSKREISYSIGVDHVKTFASARIHNALKLELMRAHYGDVTVKAKFHHPESNDVDDDIRPWLAQWSLWLALELISRDIVQKIFQKRLSREDSAEDKIDDAVEKFRLYFVETMMTFGRAEKAPSWCIEQHSENPKFVADAETLCWENVQKEEEPFDVSKDKFEDSDKKGQLEEARHLEPTPNIDGLVVDTSRTKKKRDAKMKNPRSEDVEDEEGQTPKGKSKPTKNPGSGRSSKAKKGKEKEESTKETSKDRRKKKDPPDDDTGQGSQQQPATSAAIEVQPESAMPIDDDQPEPTTAREEGTQRKRAKKQSNRVRVYEGLFITDQYFDIPNQFAVLKTSLKSTFDILQGNMTRTRKLPVPIIEELKKMCTAVASMRMSGFVLNKKQASFAADCLILDLPSGLNLEVDDNGPLQWNVYPEEDDLPRKLMTLGKSILDDRGCIIILHSRSLRSTQQIADALDAYTQVWMPIASFDVVNDVPQYIIQKLKSSASLTLTLKSRNLLVPHLMLRIPGGILALINNYNTSAPTKLDDLGRRKCTGFLQTLLENFTRQGDIVIDFAAGWGASMQAAFNCSRCCIVAEERKDALESLQLILSTIAKA